MLCASILFCCLFFIYLIVYLFGVIVLFACCWVTCLDFFGFCFRISFVYSLVAFWGGLLIVVGVILD